jgi:hypothetical protein
MSELVEDQLASQASRSALFNQPEDEAQRGGDHSITGG